MRVSASGSGECRCVRVSASGSGGSVVVSASGSPTLLSMTYFQFHFQK